MPTPSRANNGKFVRSEDNIRRDADALRLRSRGLSYQRIADELGYHDRATAYRAVEHMIGTIEREATEDSIELMLVRLDTVLEQAMAVLERHHVTVSQGRVVDLDGVPLEDDAPVLAAIDRVLKIEERRAKLLGLDAPARMEVMTIDAIDAEIRRLSDELAAGEAAETGGTPQASR